MKPERTKYLRNLADDYGLDQTVVIELAHMLGEEEDYDGLVSAVQDYAYYLESSAEELNFRIG